MISGAEELIAIEKNLHGIRSGSGEHFNPALGMQANGAVCRAFFLDPGVHMVGDTLSARVAVAEWKVDKSTCRERKTESSNHDASKRNIAYGKVAIAASKLAVPQDVPLKDPAKNTACDRKINQASGHSGKSRCAENTLALMYGRQCFTRRRAARYSGGKFRVLTRPKLGAVPGVKSVSISTELPSLPTTPGAAGVAARWMWKWTKVRTCQ